MKQPKIRFKGFTGEWVQTSWGKLTSNFKYGINAAAIPYDGKNKYLRITDVDDATRVFLQDNLSTPGTDLSCCDEYIMQDGDIVVARTGASVGKSYIYHVKDGQVYFAGFLIRMRLNGNVDKDFIFQNTLTESYAKHIKIVSQRSGQPGVNVEELKLYALNLPSAKDEQQTIANYFHHLDSLIQSTAKKIDSLKQVKAASLQSMFPQEGETTPRVRFKGFKGEWIKDTLGNIAQILKGEQINKNKLSSHGTYYVLNGGVEPSGYTENYNTKSGTISISEGGNSCGYVSYNNLNFWSGGHNYTLQNVNIDNKFLYAYLKGREHDIMSKRVGSGLPNIQKKSLQDFIVFFPFNGDEQHLLGLFFFSLDTQISLHSQRLEKLKQIKSACLDNMFV